MKKFEYQVHYVDLATAASHFNELGQEGWELTYAHVSHTALYSVLKREVKETVPEKQLING